MIDDQKTAVQNQQIIRLVLTRPTWYPATNTIELLPTTAADLGATVNVSNLLSDKDIEDVFNFVQDKIKQSLEVEKTG